MALSTALRMLSADSVDRMLRHYSLAATVPEEPTVTVLPSSVEKFGLTASAIPFCAMGVCSGATPGHN